MPYIKKENRVKFCNDIESITKNISNCGDLNYVISLICKNYFNNNGGRYQQVNDIVGALEGAKMEYYRRVAAPYEDEKILENGDVY